MGGCKQCQAPLPSKGRFCKKCGFDNGVAAKATAKCEECGKANAEVCNAVYISTHACSGSYRLFPSLSLSLSQGFAFCKACGAPPADAEKKKSPTKTESKPEVKKKKTACSSCGKPNAPGYGECACGEPEAGAKKAKPESKTEKKPEKVAAKKATVKCVECGKANAEGYKFCKSCGTPPAGAAKPTKKKKEDAAVVKEEDACLDCDTILTSSRFCGHCGLRQPTAQAFKPKSRKTVVGGGDNVEIDALFERVDEHLETLANKAKSGESGGKNAGADSAELTAEVNKWKGLFQAAAADVDEKDELLAQQMEHIAELTEQLEADD